MKLTIKKALGIFALVAFAMPSIARAQSVDVSALENQVKELTKKVAALEGSKSSQSSYGAGYVMPTEGDQGGLVHAAQDIDFGGHVATTYTNFIDQNAGFQGRSFENNEGFALNQADFFFKKDANPEGGAGFKIDILAGIDATDIDFNNTAAQTGAADDFTFKEAYVELNTPSPLGESDILPSVINWKAGRMQTLAGKEVINAQDNWNISRSVAFDFGNPYTHTGLRTQSKWFNDKLNVYMGVNNGWDQDVENNDFRTLEWALGFSPIENVNYFTTVLWGPESGAGVEDDKTFLWSVTKALNLGLNFDWGRTDDNPNTVGLDTGNTEWAGFSAYGKYQINDKWAFAERLELFRDVDGGRGVSTLGAGTGSDTFFGWTHTLEYRPYDNIITRLEYRWDRLNSGSGTLYGGDSSRNTLAAQVIYVI